MVPPPELRKYLQILSFFRHHPRLPRQRDRHSKQPAAAPISFTAKRRKRRVSGWSQLPAFRSHSRTCKIHFKLGRLFCHNINPSVHLTLQTGALTEQKTHVKLCRKPLGTNSQISADKPAAHTISTNFCLKKSRSAALSFPLSRQLILPLFRKHLKTRSRAQILLSICLVSIVIKLRPTIRDLKEKTLKRPGVALAPGTLPDPPKARDQRSADGCFPINQRHGNPIAGLQQPCYHHSKGSSPPIYSLLEKQPARRQHKFNGSETRPGSGVRQGQQERDEQEKNESSCRRGKTQQPSPLSQWKGFS